MAQLKQHRWSYFLSSPLSMVHFVISPKLLRRSLSHAQLITGKDCKSFMSDMKENPCSIIREKHKHFVFTVRKLGTWFLLPLASRISHTGGIGNNTEVPFWQFSLIKWHCNRYAAIYDLKKLQGHPQITAETAHCSVSNQKHTWGAKPSLHVQPLLWYSKQNSSQKSWPNLFRRH